MRKPQVTAWFVGVDWGVYGWRLPRGTAAGRRPPDSPPVLPHWYPLDPVTVPPVGGGVVSYPEAPMKSDGLPAPQPPRRHTSFAVPKLAPAALRSTARVTDGWTAGKPVTFDAAI